MDTTYGSIDGVNTTNVLFIRSLIMCSEPTCANLVATLVMLSTLSRNVHAVAISAHVSIEATRPMTPQRHYTYRTHMTPQAHFQVLRPVRIYYSKREMVERVTPPGRLCVLRQVFTADTLIATMPLVVDLQPRRLYVILWRVVSIDQPLTAGWLL